MSIAEKIAAVREKMAAAEREAGRAEGEVMLLPVSKTVDTARMKEALAAGCTVFGENYVQELCAKYEEMHAAGASFHFIGHLQTNKVKYIIDKVDMIHSVDSIRLAREIDRQAKKAGRIMDILIEINVGGEESKTGLPPQEFETMLAELPKLDGLRLCGLMTIPPQCEEQQLAEYFAQMRQLFVDMQAKKSDNSNIHVLSMGMSGDFPLAIRCGATIVRVGTAIFGARDYSRK